MRKSLQRTINARVLSHPAEESKKAGECLRARNSNAYKQGALKIFIVFVEKYFA